MLDRRRDLLLREVVDAVQPTLQAKGFALADRGTLRDHHWVEFARGARPWDSMLIARESCVIFHLTRDQHIGARWHPYGARDRTGPRSVTAEVWPYQSGATSPGGAPSLPGVVNAWLARMVGQSDC